MIDSWRILGYNQIIKRTEKFKRKGGDSTTVSSQNS